MRLERCGFCNSALLFVLAGLLNSGCPSNIERNSVGLDEHVLISSVSIGGTITWKGPDSPDWPCEVDVVHALGCGIVRETAFGHSRTYFGSEAQNVAVCFYFESDDKLGMPVSKIRLSLKNLNCRTVMIGGGAKFTLTNSPKLPIRARRENGRTIADYGTQTVEISGDGIEICILWE